MVKWIWFQSHWLLGITAGLVLAVVGFTGGMLSFEDEILRALNPGVMTVAARDRAVLSPAELIAAVAAAEPEKRIQAVTVHADRTRAARVSFAAAGRGPRGETRYADPYDGRLLGHPRGEDVMRMTMQIHRWLAAGDVGKQIVGASTVVLVVLALSGLYLRWPRRVADWRAWFRIDFAHKGRSFLWALHSVIGTWVLVPYVIMSLTGLYWSYEWYRNGLFDLTGTPRPASFGPPGMQQQGQGQAQGQPQRGAGAAAAPIDIAALWARFLTEAGGYSQATLRLPAGPGQPVQVMYQDPDPPHERANNTLALDPRTGEVRSHRRYAALPPGQKFMASIFVLHSGGFFGIGGLVLFMLSSLLMPLFAITGWMLYLDRRAKRRAARSLARGLAALAADGSPEVLVAFASQSGAAERVAWRSARMLQEAGIPVAVEPLGRLDAGRLARAERALFVVSTFGDGEPPDGARGFERRVMAEAAEPRLPGLRYGLLALGDSQYERFCGFGHSLDQWLRRQGAAPLFDLVEVDRSDDGALRHWQHHLGALGGKAGLPDWTTPAYGRWRLVERRLLNPGSSGGPCYHLSLEPVEAAQWAAGDIAEIGPCHPPAAVAAFLAEAGLDGSRPVARGGRTLTLAEAVAESLLPLPEDLAGLAPQQAADRLAPLPSREYSIASLPADGRLDLLVRQAVREDGTHGLGSGWLTAHAALGAEIALRIRENPSFHGPAPDRPLILIGNGTGLAGLRAHLKARAAAGAGPNWLVFGERQAACDFHHRAEIEAWLADGTLARIDLAFSRDQARRLYVQHRLAAAAETLRAWVADGAAIYVCGSLAGMAPGVEATLVEILGAATVERLADEGRYRRDVY